MSVGGGRKLAATAVDVLAAGGRAVAVGVADGVRVGVGESSGVGGWLGTAGLGGCGGMACLSGGVGEACTNGWVGDGSVGNARTTGVKVGISGGDWKALIEAGSGVSTGD